MKRKNRKFLGIKDQGILGNADGAELCNDWESGKFQGGLLGFEVSKLYLLLWVFVLFTLHISLFTFYAYAQDTVEIEAEAISVESELELKDLMAAKKPQPQGQPVEVKTRMHASDVKIPEMDGDSMDPEIPDPDVIDKGLLDAQRQAVKADVIREEEVVRINQTLRRAIEQNRKLQEEKKRMKEQLGRLRGETRLEDTRRQALRNQVDRYEKRIQQAVEVQQDLGQTIEQLQEKIKTREQVLLARINDLQKELEGDVQKAEGGDMTVKGTKNISGEKAGDIVQAQEEGLDVIHLIDDLDSMRSKMREDEARVHYNMGNIFFHQGEYQQALGEYGKTLAIDPNDANAHFNLAYIAGDFLKEFETAVKHYKQYLYLNPSAEDAPLVKEKILEAQLYVHSWKGSNVDHTVQEDRPKELYTW